MSAAFCCLVLLSLPLPSSADSGMDKAAASEKTLSLHVNKAPCTEILRSLAEMTGKNIVFSGTITETVTADLDKVTPEEAISSILASCGLAGRTEGSTLIVFNSKMEKNAGVMMRPFRLSYADAREVYNKSANTVIVKGTPFELMQAESLIRELDVPEKQVKVEAEVVAVNKTYAKELGIDWDFKSLTGSASYDRTSWTEQHYVTGRLCRNLIREIPLRASLYIFLPGKAECADF